MTSWWSSGTTDRRGLGRRQVWAAREIQFKYVEFKELWCIWVQMSSRLRKEARQRQRWEVSWHSWWFHVGEIKNVQGQHAGGGNQAITTHQTKQTETSFSFFPTQVTPGFPALLCGPTKTGCPRMLSSPPSLLSPPSGAVQHLLPPDLPVWGPLFWESSSSRSKLDYFHFTWVSTQCQLLRKVSLILCHYLYPALFSWYLFYGNECKLSEGRDLALCLAHRRQSINLEGINKLKVIMS